MLTGALRSKIDRVWDAFWSGGISKSASPEWAHEVQAPKHFDAPRLVGRRLSEASATMVDEGGLMMVDVDPLGRLAVLLGQAEQ